MRLIRELTCRFPPMPRWAWPGTTAAHKTLANNNENTSETMAAGWREWPEGTDFIPETSRQAFDAGQHERERSSRDQASIKREQDPRELSRAIRLQIVADSADSGAGVAK
jgi:hypothetical protein